MDLGGRSEAPGTRSQPLVLRDLFEETVSAEGKSGENNEMKNKEIHQRPGNRCNRCEYNYPHHPFDANCRSHFVVVVAVIDGSIGAVVVIVACVYNICVFLPRKLP